MDGQGIIHLKSDHALIQAEGLIDRLVSYDDASDWQGTAVEEAGFSDFVIVMPAEATLRIALPAMPANSRELRRMLSRSAPLALSALIWTEAVPDKAGTGALVTLARRDWIDARFAAIRRRMASATLTIVDADGSAFTYRERPYRSLAPIILAICATAAILASAMIYGWKSPRIETPPLTVATMQPSKPVQSDRIEAVPLAQPAPVRAIAAGTELELVGIAGRLPDEAEVLVKTPWGKTTTMHRGDSLLGWTLIAVDPDRITLEKDGIRDEIVLPTPDQ